MKYRAIAVGLRVNERPVQIYGGDRDAITEWARGIADSHGVQVEIHATTETLIEVVGPKEGERK